MTSRTGTGTRIDTAIIILLGVAVLSDYVPVAVDFGVWTLTAQRATLLLIGMLAVWNISRRRKVLLTSAVVGWLLLLSLLFASVVWSIAPLRSITKLDSLVVFTCAVVGLLSLPATERTFRQLTTVLLAVGGCLAVLGVSWAVLGDIGSPLVLKLVNRNQYTRHIAALLPMAYAAAYSSSGRKRIGTAVIAVMLTVLLPAAGSRSGFVAFVFVIGLLTIVSLRGIADISFLRMVLVLGVFIPIVLLSATTAIRLGLLPDRLARIPISPSQLFSPEVLGPVRYGIYVREIEVIRANWLTGIGFASFLELSGNVPFDDAYQSHNIVSRVWLAAGLPAVVLLFINYILTIRSYIGSIIHDASIDRSYVAAYAIGFAGLSVAGLANVVIYDVLFWVFIMCGTVLIPMVRGGSVPTADSYLSD